MVKKKATKVAKTYTPPPVRPTLDALKTSVLIVSLLINLAVFIGWVILRVTSKYDEQVFNFLFTR